MVLHILNGNKGVTLIELLIIIVIMGIGMSVAVPSFQGMIVRNRIITQTNDLILAVNLARSEATRTGEQVSILPVSNVANNEYGAGYCVVRGVNPPTTCGDVANADDVVRYFEPLTGETTMNSIENAKIEFNTLGGLMNQPGHNIDLCYPDFDGRRIRINLIGRPKSHMEDKDGVAVPAPLAENQPCTCVPQSPHC